MRLLYGADVHVRIWHEHIIIGIHIPQQERLYTDTHLGKGCLPELRPSLPFHVGTDEGDPRRGRGEELEPQREKAKELSTWVRTEII